MYKKSVSKSKKVNFMDSKLSVPAVPQPQQEAEDALLKIMKQKRNENN
jgi:hypothetical protein